MSTETPDAATEPGTAIATAGTYEAPQASVLQRKRAFSDPGTVELIRQTVAKECTNAELGMFLELAARYDLDPFAKHIYAAKIDGRVAIIVAKDGMLAIANRHADYLGADNDVVREHDQFDKWIGEDGLPHVEHRYDVKHDDDGKPVGSKADPEARGRIVAAWAIVYRAGRRPTYAFASFKDYDKGKFTWKSHPDAMMKKVPLVIALREAYSIGGVVGEGEVDEWGSGNGGPQNLTTVASDDYGQDPAIAAKLLQMFELLGYTQRKRTIKLAGQIGTGLNDEGRRGLLHDLLAEAEERGLEVPSLPHEDAIDGTLVEEPAESAA